MYDYRKFVGFVLTFVVLMTIDVSAQTQKNRTNIEPNKSGFLIRNPVTDKEDEYVQPANEKFELGKWAEGRDILEKGLSKYPEYSDLHMLMGKYYLYNKTYDSSRYELHKALQYDSGNEDAKQLLISVETETKRYSNAIGYINELLQNSPYDKDLWKKKIRLYELQGNSVESNRLRKRLTQIYPEDVELRKDYLYGVKLEADTRRKEGNLDEAIRLREEILQKEPQDPENYIRIANDFLQSGDDAQALRYLERGLNYFPKNELLIQKKAGILGEENRYDKLLPFLREKGMISDYNYYLKEAGRAERNKDPEVLYKKVFMQNPADDEAFSYVFDKALNAQREEEALEIIARRKGVKGDSKELQIKELSLYKRMQKTAKVNALTKRLFKDYSDDVDLQEQYVRIKLEEAKAQTADENYEKALKNWEEVKKYADPELKQTVDNSIYNAHLALGNYNQALKVLNIMNEEDSLNRDIIALKRADIALKQKDYSQAIKQYGIALKVVPDNKKDRYLESYSEMMLEIVKKMIDKYQYKEAMSTVDQWLSQDPENAKGLHYGYNIAYMMRNIRAMKSYAELGLKAHPEDTFFQVKMAELKLQDTEEYAQSYSIIHKKLVKSPYHKELIDIFSVTAQKYAFYLMEKDSSEQALAKLDSALVYNPESKDLRYAKGLVYEKLHQYDSAYYYQGFYRPSALEVSEFKQHQAYLNYRNKQNEISLSYLRDRHGNQYAFNTISGIQYNRKEKYNTYSGRVNYTGRAQGKGIQMQAEWDHYWNERTHTTIRGAWANRYFPEYVVSASVFRETKALGGFEFELGVGYRKLEERTDSTLVGHKSMNNFLIGLSKDFDSFRLNLKFDNFIMDGEWLYNFGLNTRYNLNSPQNYIMGIVAVGTSPDVQLIDYQLYNGFSILNTMVGAGYGRSIANNITANIFGNWYNYRNNEKYRNFYSITFNLNVAF